MAVYAAMAFLYIFSGILRIFRIFVQQLFKNEGRYHFSFSVLPAFLNSCLFFRFACFFKFMYKKVSKTCIKVVKDNLKEKLKDGIKVGSNIINVNSISRNEFTKSENSQYYEKYNNKKYEDKFKATNYADEILNASRNYVNEDLKHLRKDNITQFARETVLLKVGDNDYSADFVVGYTSGTT